MNKKLSLIAALLGSMLIGYAVALVTYTIIIPSIGRTRTVEITVAWLNGTEITSIDWGKIENNTETSLHSLINITNNGDKEAVLSISAVNLVNITAITLSWNATSPLSAGASTTAQLNMTVTASEQTFSYDTRIDATG